VEEHNKTVAGLIQFDYKGKAELVYEKIRQAIMDGILKPGDKLDTDQIAKTLKVSRMPVREAIKRLQLEGLVEVKPHKEVTVAIVTIDQMKDVLSVRSALEGLAAREASLRINDDEPNKLWSLYKEMEKMVETGETEGLLIKNREFHRFIHEISGNKVLQSIAENLFDSIERFRLQFMSMPRRPRQDLKEHLDLIEAIGSHDPEKAERLMRKHIENTGQIMFRYADGNVKEEERPKESMDVKAVDPKLEQKTAQD
jgi:DNA-binding GntR family transcriptional regulator